MRLQGKAAVSYLKQHSQLVQCKVQRDHLGLDLSSGLSAVFRWKLFPSDVE